jgi:hypothetical protein
VLLGFDRFGAVSISDSAMALARHNLQRFEQLLSNKESWVPESVHEVRLQLAYIASLLREALPARKQESTYEVYHINHAENLRIRSVEEIAGANWLTQ